MDRLEEHKRELLEDIRRSPQMVRFEAARTSLQGMTEKKEQIDQFRRKVYQAQNSTEPFDRLDEMRNLYREREQLHKDPQIAEFLNAELELCRLLQEICNGILGLADVEIEAFEHDIV